MSSLRDAWQSRTDSERAILAAVGALGAIALLAAFAWLPLERARARLSADLPALRASIETMRRQADEAKRLRAISPSASLKAPVAQLAASPPTGAQVAALDAQRVRLSSSDAAFTTLLEWIVAAQASHGLRVESARIDALAAPGRVKADIVLTRS